MLLSTKPNKVVPVFQLFSRSEWFLTEILELTPDCLLLIDVRTNLVVYANKASETLYGYNQEAFIGKDIRLINLSPDSEIKKNMERVIKKYPHAHRFEAIHGTSSGKQVPVEVVSKLVTLNGRKYYLSHITNITSRNRLKNKISNLITQLSQQAYRDNLTQTYNRNYLFNVYLPKLTGRDIGLLLVKIDYFKNINHTKGHLLGDHILIETAKLLKSAIRSTGKVFQFDGGEFLILFPKHRIGELEQTAASIREIVLKAGLYFEDRPVRYSVSVGYTAGLLNCPQQFNELLIHADEHLSQP